MGRKIFVSYKYEDANVQPLNSSDISTARDYVNHLQSLLKANSHIYKGEHGDESLEGFLDETIASKLRDKIFDSSITIVLVSSNMKDPRVSEKDQWIPWEISYSLRVNNRGDRTSQMNAMIAVVLPDNTGSYEYLIDENICCNCNCINVKVGILFEILRNNMFNAKQKQHVQCFEPINHGPVHAGDHSYIPIYKWDDFISDTDSAFVRAEEIRSKADEYEIQKNL